LERQSTRTKDAPVDGKDGKPKIGPFVGSDKDTIKTKTEDLETVLGKVKEEASDLVSKDGSKLPAVNDGVMNDPGRELPKEGTTGTEGGVSEKDKARVGGTFKTPDSPKEAPPLPLSEDAKSKIEKTKAKDTDADEDDGLGGLEVCSCLECIESS
jgi:hypothetical protein